jgi:hypothetical protein
MPYPSKKNLKNNNALPVSTLFTSTKMNKGINTDMNRGIIPKKDQINESALGK